LQRPARRLRTGRRERTGRRKADCRQGWIFPSGRRRRRPDGAWLSALAADIGRLRDRGQQVLVVSSGAVALGRKRLSLGKRALTLPEKQAAAAAGQSALMRAWELALEPFGLSAAQILLTRDDTEVRRRWLNARATTETLLTLGVIPVVNENDTVVTEEIRYGDNDRLAARVAQMIGADVLVLLSDIDGLYSADPRSNPDAVHIPRLTHLTAEIEAMAGAPIRGRASAPAAWRPRSSPPGSPSRPAAPPSSPLDPARRPWRLWRPASPPP